METVVDDRIVVPDLALVRQARGRVVLNVVVPQLLITFFTAGGCSVAVAGQVPGSPFAVGGGLVQLGLLVLAISAVRISRAPNGATIARPTVEAARWSTRTVGWAGTLVIITVLGFAGLRWLVGDRATLLTAGIISVVLAFVVRGARHLHRVHTTSLTVSSPR